MITLRSQLNRAMTHAELDQNFIDLRDGVAMRTVKDKGNGILIDSQGTPDFGWHDIIGNVNVRSQGTNFPAFNIYRGGLRQYQFGVNDEIFNEFHVPHDHAPGTAIYLHVHWSHNVAAVGALQWLFEVSYAKGHSQEVFSVPVTLTCDDAGANEAYRHIICEEQLTATVPTAAQIDADRIEPDGVFLVRTALAANASGVAPFVHYVDMHYQSTAIPTKQKSPDFWT